MGRYEPTQKLSRMTLEKITAGSGYITNYLLRKLVLQVRQMHG